MNINVQKPSSYLEGSATIPGSKSESIRAILFALLAAGESKLSNIPNSEDVEVAKNICAGLGAEISTTHNISIKSHGLPLKSEISELYTHNSGITTLFTLPLLGLRKDFEKPILLNCGEQMQARPIKPLVDALRKLGMTIDYVNKNNQLPLLVSGKLKGGFTEVDGQNSQYLSALLISLPCAENDSVITVTDLHERPYINMTLSFLQEQKIKFSHTQKNNVDTFMIKGQQHYKSFVKNISGDFSSASCVIAGAVLLPGTIEILGLNFDDSQGDKRLIPILQEMGANITIQKNNLIIKGGTQLKGIRIDANDIPDLLPALAVIATQATGETAIINVAQARIKEVDRIRSMTENLRKMGARIDEHTDGMTIYQSTLRNAVVEGYGDHRTVMALTIAGMLCDGFTTITDGEAINKTYPQFIKTMQKLSQPNSIIYHMNRHIILIGFKNVGKSLIGQYLAKTLHLNFMDIDRELEHEYKIKFQNNFSCREIMKKHGENFYRELESEILQKIVTYPTSIISLGGGTVLHEKNQSIIKNNILLHVDAPPGIVFERIMIEGIPAFFDPKKDHYDSFQHLWIERSKIYKKLTGLTVYNHKTIDDAVKQAIQHISEYEETT